MSPLFPGEERKSTSDTGTVPLNKPRSVTDDDSEKYQPRGATDWRESPSGQVDSESEVSRLGGGGDESGAARGRRRKFSFGQRGSDVRQAKTPGSPPPSPPSWPDPETRPK